MAAAGDLPQDLTEDILSRLPVKSLLRFRCIHKSWYSLFKSSSFITTHLQNPNSKEHGLSCGFILVILREKLNENYSYKFLRRDTYNVCLDGVVLPFQLSHSYHYYSAGSCNGLVCIWFPSTIHGTQFTVFNFSLKQHKIIPLSNYLPSSTTSESCGFGYDSKNNVYKVARVHFGYDHARKLYGHAEVHTLGTNSWRKVALPDVVFRPVNQRNNFQAFLNGAIHWLGYKNERGCVICFDVSSEVFQLFPLPDCLDEVSLYNTSIDVYGDLLSLVKGVRRSGDDKYYDLWVMREYGVNESWIRLHSIQVLSWDNMNKYFVGFGINRELLLVGYDSRLTALNPDKEEVKNIEFGQPVHSSSVVPYIESLVSLEEDNE